jgi:hypothetical protein
VVANHPSGFFDLAAAPRQPLAATAWPTSPRKTRVRGFRRRASGQTSSRRRCRSMFTPGSRGCGYKTVSGRHEWLNRDPIQEWGGINMYGFVRNNPIKYFDFSGLACAGEIERDTANGWGLKGQFPMPKIPETPIDQIPGAGDAFVDWMKEMQDTILNATAFLTGTPDGYTYGEQPYYPYTPPPAAPPTPPPPPPPVVYAQLTSGNINAPPTVVNIPPVQSPYGPESDTWGLFFPNMK